MGVDEWGRLCARLTLNRIVLCDANMLKETLAYPKSALKRILDSEGLAESTLRWPLALFRSDGGGYALGRGRADLFDA
jgi:hypothetical protein